MTKETRMRFLIVGPAGLAREEMEALKGAVQKTGNAASAFRTDEDFQLSALRTEIRDAEPRFTHMLLVLDRVCGYEDSILHEAGTAKIEKVSFLCMYTDQSLNHYAQRLRDDRVCLVVVRSHVEHSRVRSRWNRVNTLVVESLVRDSDRIAEMLVGNQSTRRTVA